MKRKIIEIIEKNYDVVGGTPKLQKEKIASEILDLFDVSGRLFSEDQHQIMKQMYENSIPKEYKYKKKWLSKGFLHGLKASIPFVKLNDH